MRFNVGDTVYCHTDVIMTEDGERCVTAGKTYIIISGDPFNFGGSDLSFYIINDGGRRHSFQYSNGSRWFKIPFMKPIKRIKKFEL